MLEIALFVPHPVLVTASDGQGLGPDSFWAKLAKFYMASLL